ncbi:MAG: hypothetical protein H6912_01635 [Kordiimonadaceae bacterium]|nr:hypothetical protein [Kordiimonadaceae bacterium]
MSIYFLIPTLLAVALSMLVVRAGAIALVITGMNYEKAKFQAWSAFSGTGFTTQEAEKIVNNPKRRKIITWLMILGNAGVVTVIVTATSSFTNAQGLEAGRNALILFAGLGAGYFIVRHTSLIHIWEKYSHDFLTKLDIFSDDSSIDELLHVNEGYGVIRLRLDENLEANFKYVSDITDRLHDGLILGLENENGWIAAPDKETSVSAGDTLTIYGKLDKISDLINIKAEDRLNLIKD